MPWPAPGPTVFRAVAVIAGANLSGCSSASQPVAYFGIHGTHDSVLNISNGPVAPGRLRPRQRLHRAEPAGARGRAAEPTSPPRTRAAGPDIRSAGPPHDGDHVPLPTDRNASTSWVSGEVWPFFTQFGGTDPADDPDARPDQPRADDAGTDHPAARERGLPGDRHRQRLEQRADRGPHRHQHRQLAPSTAGLSPSPCPRDRPSPAAGTPPTPPPPGGSRRPTSATTRAWRPARRSASDSRPLTPATARLRPRTR